MKFNFEFRSNGLAYITVFDGDKIAGSFSLARADALKLGEALLEAGVAVEGDPDALRDQPAPPPAGEPMDAAPIQQDN